MVGVTGFEPATSCSQSRRATNCATPRYSFLILLTNFRFYLLLCPPSCGARHLQAYTCNFLPLRQTQLTFSSTGCVSLSLPKAGALPTALHPVKYILFAFSFSQPYYYTLIFSLCQGKKAFFNKFLVIIFFIKL